MNKYTREEVIALYQKIIMEVHAQFSFYPSAIMKALSEKFILGFSPECDIWIHHIVLKWEKRKFTPDEIAGKIATRIFEQKENNDR